MKGHVPINTMRGISKRRADEDARKTDLRKKDPPTSLRSAPVYAFSCWAEIRARIQASEQCALFLDFDGTLVEFEQDPNDVQTPPNVKTVLKSIVRHSSVFVAIITGRKLTDIRRRIAIEGLHYAGLHGAEMEGKSPRLTAETRHALDRARRAARQELSSLPAVWIEDKRFGFAIHHRGASADVARETKREITRILTGSRDRLRLQPGHQVLEVLPVEITGKWAAVREMLGPLPIDIATIYIGDDNTDESAFAGLANQIGIRVGRKRTTQANYYLRGTADVLRFLTRLEKILP